MSQVGETEPRARERSARAPQLSFCLRRFSMAGRNVARPEFTTLQNDGSDPGDLAIQNRYQANLTFPIDARFPDLRVGDWQRRPRFNHVRRVVCRRRPAHGRSNHFQERSRFLRAKLADGQGHPRSLLACDPVRYLRRVLSVSFRPHHQREAVEGHWLFLRSHPPARQRCARLPSRVRLPGSAVRPRWIDGRADDRPGAQRMGSGLKIARLKPWVFSCAPCRPACSWRSRASWRAGGRPPPRCHVRRRRGGWP